MPIQSRLRLAVLIAASVALPPISGAAVGLPQVPPPLPPPPPIISNLINLNSSGAAPIATAAPSSVPTMGPAVGPLSGVEAGPLGGQSASPDGGPSPTRPAVALAAAALAAIGLADPGSPSNTPAPAEARSDSRPGSGEGSGAARRANEMVYAQFQITLAVAELGLGDDAAAALQFGGGSGQFGWPLRYRVVTQGFGCTALRLAPLSGICSSGHFHTGLDIAGPDQAEVLAADAGVARVFRGAAGYGNHVIVTHGNGYATLYGHLHDIVVKDGELVRRGDLLAHEGSTGNSTGPHLHFEVRRDAGFVDPCPFLESCR
ncbi:MAG: hypothetical protein NVS9B1_03810 [Candidatus Dormibacteraceae bacterium]